MLLVLDVDHAPAVLPPPDGLAVDDDVTFGPDDRERDHVLRAPSAFDQDARTGTECAEAYADGFVELSLFGVVVVAVERIKPDVVVLQLLPDLSEAALRVSDS